MKNTATSTADCADCGHSLPRHWNGERVLCYAMHNPNWTHSYQPRVYIESNGGPPPDWYIMRELGVH